MQKLRHGRFLTSKNFPKFVETWNDIVDFVSNIRGDGDGIGNGQIKLDRSVSGHPVVRFRNIGISNGGGSGGSDNSCFRIEKRMVGDDEHTFIACCYYNIGGMTGSIQDTDVTNILPSGEGVSFLCFKIAGSSKSIVLISESNLESEQMIASNYVCPLYKFVGQNMTDDLRNALNIQMFEGGLT